MVCTRQANLTDGTEDWNGIAQDMLEKLVIGKTYQISAWVKIVDSGQHMVHTHARALTYPFLSFILKDRMQVLATM